MDFNHTAVARYPKLGNGLKATRDLAPGDDIVRIDEPYLIIVEKAALNLVCSQCLHEKEKLQRCTGCKVVYYCSRACQSIAWREGHKLECPIYQRLPDVLPTEVRGVMGLLLKKKFGLKPDLRWISLEGHAPALRRTGRWDDIVLQAKAAVEFSGSPARCIETAVEFLCRMAANAFRVTLPEATETGLCFEPVLAMANHDCDPNAFVMFDGRKVFLRTLNPIKQGEQIFISYIDTVLPRDTRLADLQASYFFTCTCHKCTSDSGTYTTFIRAFPPISYPRLDLFVDPKSLDLTHNLEPWADKVQQVWEFHIKNSFGPALIMLLYIFLNYDIYRYPQPIHPHRVHTLWQIFRIMKIIAQTADDEQLVKNAACVPRNLMVDFDYISGVQVILILIMDLAPKSHGESSKFVQDMREELAFVEGVQRQRGSPLGEKFKEWAHDEHAEGQGYARKIFEGLRELAGYGTKLVDEVS